MLTTRYSIPAGRRLLHLPGGKGIYTIRKRPQPSCFTTIRFTGCCGKSHVRRNLCATPKAQQLYSPGQRPTAVELRDTGANGLLSPALSSRGGEGDAPKVLDKALNSTAVRRGGGGIIGSPGDGSDFWFEAGRWETKLAKLRPWWESMMANGKWQMANRPCMSASL